MVLQLHSVEVLDSQDGEQRLKESHLWAFRHAVEESEAVETHNSLLPAFPGPSWKCSKTHCHLNRAWLDQRDGVWLGLGNMSQLLLLGCSSLLSKREHPVSPLWQPQALPCHHFRQQHPLYLFSQEAWTSLVHVAVHVPGTPLPWPSLEQLK